MADVFISYSKQDRTIAEALAQYLENEGYVVWWDPSLVAGESYRDKIDKELNAARAVIVIWSPNSVASEWVISEAEHGARSDNLITLRTADVAEATIPRPFNTRHMDLANDFPAVRAALKRMAVEPLYKEDEHGLSPHDRYWATIESSEHWEDFESYLQEFPDGAHAPLARLTVARLKRREPEAGAKPRAQRQTSDGSAGRSIGTMLMAALAGAAGAGAGSYAFWQQVHSTESGRAETAMQKALTQVKVDIVRAVDVATDVTRQAIDEVKASQSAEAGRSEILVKWAEEDKAWATATSEQLIEHWKGYLKDFPSGRYVRDAQRAIQLRAENNYFIPKANWPNMARGAEISKIAAEMEEAKALERIGTIKVGALTINYADVGNESSNGWYKYEVSLKRGSKSEIIWGSGKYVEGESLRIFTFPDSPLFIVGTAIYGSSLFVVNGNNVEKLRDFSKQIVAAGPSPDNKLMVARDSAGNAYAWDFSRRD